MGHHTRFTHHSPSGPNMNQAYFTTCPHTSPTCTTPRTHADPHRAPTQGLQLPHTIPTPVPCSSASYLPHSTPAQTAAPHWDGTTTQDGTTPHPREVPGFPGPTTCSLPRLGHSATLALPSPPATCATYPCRWTIFLTFILPCCLGQDPLHIFFAVTPGHTLQHTHAADYTTFTHLYPTLHTPRGAGCGFPTTQVTPHNALLHTRHTRDCLPRRYAHRLPHAFVTTYPCWLPRPHCPHARSAALEGCLLHMAPPPPPFAPHPIAHPSLPHDPFADLPAYPHWAGTACRRGHSCGKRTRCLPVRCLGARSLPAYRYRFVFTGRLVPPPGFWRAGWAFAWFVWTFHRCT